MRFPTDPERQLKIEALVEALDALPVDGVLKYAAASKIADEDDADRTKDLLRAAVKRAELQSSARFGNVRNVGIRRLTAEELPGIGSATRSRIGKAARKGFVRLSDIRSNDVPQTLRSRLDAERSVLGAIASMSRETTVKKIERGEKTAPQIASLTKTKKQETDQ